MTTTETLNLTPELKTSIALAAINAAGEDTGTDWQDNVAAKVCEITAMLDPRSAVMQTMESMTGPNTKKFTGIVRKVVKEKSSQRGVVTLETRPSKHHPNGMEEARTERVDNPSGRRVANKLRSLVGHRVLVWVELEEFDGGSKKVRVVRHIEDLGLVKESDA